MYLEVRSGPVWRWSTRVTEAWPAGKVGVRDGLGEVVISTYRLRRPKTEKGCQNSSSKFSSAIAGVRRSHAKRDGQPNRKRGQLAVRSAGRSALPEIDFSAYIELARGRPAAFCHHSLSVTASSGSGWSAPRVTSPSKGLHMGTFSSRWRTPVLLAHYANRGASGSLTQV
jgi:hypothetical protein